MLKLTDDRINCFYSALAIRPTREIKMKMKMLCVSVECAVHRSTAVCSKIQILESNECRSIDVVVIDRLKYWIDCIPLISIIKSFYMLHVACYKVTLSIHFLYQSAAGFILISLAHSFSG